MTLGARGVIDTNVFVSAALKDKSTPASAVKMATASGILLKSTETERQLFEVLSRPYFVSHAEPENPFSKRQNDQRIPGHQWH